MVQFQAIIVKRQFPVKGMINLCLSCKSPLLKLNIPFNYSLFPFPSKTRPDIINRRAHYHYY